MRDRALADPASASIIGQPDAGFAIAKESFSIAEKLAGPPHAMQHVAMPEMRILLVEDEPLIRLFVVDALEEYGVLVEEAENATEAMAKLVADNGLFDAVVIDVGLPDRPGDILSNELRTRWANLPIVIATGGDTREFARDYAQDSGMVVLGKPYTTELLLDALRQVGVDTARSNPPD